MIKNLCTRSSLLLVYFITTYSVIVNPIQTSRHATSDHPTIIAFDLHGVIFDVNYTEVIKKTAAIFAHWNGLLLLLNPDFWLDLVLLACNLRQFEFLLQRYPTLQKNIENLSDIIQGHELIPEMPAIIHQLKSDGYKLYLFSNIAEKHVDKLQKQFPELFADFDGLVVASPKDGWIQKPNKKAYEKFLTSVHTQPENVLFIDDQLNNIKAAQQLGFKTIHFISPKQLINELQSLQSN